MVMNTKAMSGEKVMKGEEAGAPEGYEFVQDDEGRMAIRKLKQVKTIDSDVVKTTKKKVKKKVTK